MGIEHDAFLGGKGQDLAGELGITTPSKFQGVHSLAIYNVVTDQEMLTLVM